MRHRRFARWAAVLALVIAPAMKPVTADETATITITGTFKMDGLSGTVGADLAEVFANGHEHTWTATLHGVTHEHVAGSWWASTLVSATSAEFQFSGPDAAVLNDVVGDQLGGSGAFLRLDHYYDGAGNWYNSAWSLGLSSGAGVSFSTYDDLATYPLPGLNGAFPTDANGYPVLPSQLIAYESDIGDGRNGNSGMLVSNLDTLELTGDIGPFIPPIPPTLSIDDTAVAEGNRAGSLNVWVRLSHTSDQPIRVSYRTVDGTAISVGGKRTKADYGSVSGTLTFQRGETFKAIVISIKSDRTREPDESFTVELFNGVGATLEDGVATVTLRNDD